MYFLYPSNPAQIPYCFWWHLSYFGSWCFVFNMQEQIQLHACRAVTLKVLKLARPRGVGALWRPTCLVAIFLAFLCCKAKCCSAVIYCHHHWVQGKLCPGAQLSGAQGVQVIRAMPESKHSFPVDVFPKCMVWDGTDLGGGWGGVVLIIRVPAIINSTFMAW